MKILVCDDSHRDAWNAYAAADPTASLYHLYDWRRVNHACFGHRSTYLAAVEQGRIVGIFPVVQVKSRLFGNIACSLPFVNYGGPCAATADVESRLLAEAAEILRSWRADYLEMRSRRRLGEYPTSLAKVSLTLALDRDPDVLWNRFKSDHRRDIRAGYKRGFVARFGGLDLLDDFYAVLSETWRDLGTPIYAKSYLAEILRTFPDATEIRVIYKDNEPAAAAFDGFCGGVAEGMWLGARSKFRRDLVGYVLYWEGIKRACERGLDRFHLGRSTAESGAETFKKKWNAEPLQLYWQYILRSRPDIPQLNVSNSKYRLAIDMWRRLPVPVTQVVGPFIARSIP